MKTAVIIVAQEKQSISQLTTGLYGKALARWLHSGRGSWFVLGATSVGHVEGLKLIRSAKNALSVKVDAAGFETKHCHC